MKALWLILAVPAIVVAIWIGNAAVGTRWAALIGAGLFFSVFCGDLWSEVRGGRSPLQRFEEREQRRHAA